MRVTRRRTFYIIVIIVVILLILQTSNRILKKRQEQTSLPQVQAERIVPVQVARVQRAEIKSFLTVSGLIEPKEIVRVFAKSIGQAREVLVEEGDLVKKNDVLMRLDDEQIQLQVAQAKANLDLAKASLERIKAGARPQEINQAEAAVRQAKVNLDSAEENYQKMQKLFSEGAVSEQQHDQAKNHFEIAQAQYQAASESYKLVTEGASPEDIKTVEAQVKQAQSALELAQSQLGNTIIRAPISGSVTALSVKTGELVSSAIPLLSIMDKSELYLKTGISEKDIAAVTIGQQSEVFIDAFSGKAFSGEVTSKGAIVDPLSKTLEIKIKIVEPHIDILPGMFGRANILIAHNPDTLVIPSTALSRRLDGIFVFVLDKNNETIQKTPVIIGITHGNQVEVIDGLLENEIIVILGNIALEEGERVRVTNREDIE